MPVVPGILRPEIVSSTDPSEVPGPVRDGVFAKELTKRVGQNPQPLEPTRTHLSGGEAAQALGAAWRQRFGEAAPSGALEVLVADWAHETGHGRAMMNYNFGGIKGVGPSGLSAGYLTTEGAGDAEHKIVDRFRAYRSATEGAADYVGLLANRFPRAIEAARAGNAAEFVHALKQGGYFTGSEDSYASSVVSLAERARTHGFDALGASPAPAGAQAAPMTGLGPAQPASSATLVASGAAHLYASVAPSLAQANALAMTDELSRAALRIAASQPDLHDEDIWNDRR